MNDIVANSIEQLVAALKSSGAKTVYLFGSAAKGTMRGDSDLDLAVSGLPPENLFKALSAASNVVDRSIHLIAVEVHLHGCSAFASRNLLRN